MLHHSLSTSGGAGVVRSWHLARGFDDIGYHFIVGKNGLIETGRDIRLVGAHAVGKNYDSIGVCLIGDHTHTEPLYEQLAVLPGLYHQLCRLYSTRLEIDFHRPLSAKHPCPGVRLDRDDALEIMYRASPY